MRIPLFADIIPLMLPHISADVLGKEHPVPGWDDTLSLIEVLSVLQTGQRSLYDCVHRHVPRFFITATCYNGCTSMTIEGDVPVPLPHGPNGDQTLNGVHVHIPKLTLQHKDQVWSLRTPEVLATTPLTLGWEGIYDRISSRDCDYSPRAQCVLSLERVPVCIDQSVRLAMPELGQRRPAFGAVIALRNQQCDVLLDSGITIAGRTDNEGGVYTGFAQLDPTKFDPNIWVDTAYRSADPVLYRDIANPELELLPLDLWLDDDQFIGWFKINHEEVALYAGRFGSDVILCTRQASGPYSGERTLYPTMHSLRPRSIGRYYGAMTRAMYAGSNPCQHTLIFQRHGDRYYASLYATNMLGDSGGYPRVVCRVHAPAPDPEHPDRFTFTPSLYDGTAAPVLYDVLGMISAAFGWSSPSAADAIITRRLLLIARQGSSAQTPMMSLEEAVQDYEAMKASRANISTL